MRNIPRINWRKNYVHRRKYIIEIKKKTKSHLTKK
jgi:hypothetical protein